MRVNGEIKELDWKKQYGCYVARFSNIIYEVCKDEDDGYLIRSILIWHNQSSTIKGFKTLKDAKAFAQDHFNNLIKGAVCEDNGS